MNFLGASVLDTTVSNLLTLTGAAGAGAGGLLAARVFRRRGLNRWIARYVATMNRRRAPKRGETVHVLLCIADHFEPAWGNASAELATNRVRRWVEQYPVLFSNFRDSDGRVPKHSFFYPMESYDPCHLDALADLCQRGFGEVEVHLHHDRDNSTNLRRRLIEYKQALSHRHGLLARRRASDDAVYGFIHGNWALDNARHDGRFCGVNDELTILRETGCYADFTLPAAPDAAQTRKINSIYYAIDDPQRPGSHNDGIDVGTRTAAADALMLIQGPLLLDWWNRSLGIFPRIENGCIQESQRPTMRRLNLWLKACVQVPQRRDWYFVKLHTHGAPAGNQQMLLGEPMVHFHAGLASRAAADASFHFHYVTAREMYNLVKAAEAGWSGTVDAARDFELLPPRCREVANVQAA